MKAKFLRLVGLIGLFLGICTLSACFEASYPGGPYAYGGPAYSAPAYAYPYPEYRYAPPPPRVYAYHRDDDRGQWRDHGRGQWAHERAAHHEHEEHEHGER